MQYRLKHRLGFIDARKCNDLGASLAIDAAQLGAGETIELPKKAADYLAGLYPGLMEPAEKVKGVAKQPELTGPAK